MSKASFLIDLARKADAQLATAESCTGGLIAGAITDIAGASDVFDRGFVTYSNAAKVEMLGVRAATIDLFGAVSEQVASAMAQGALERSEATVTAAVTGIAGPGGSESKPEGLVCFAIANRGHPVHTETVEFGARGRSEVRKASVEHALDLLIHTLEQELKRS